MKKRDVLRHFGSVSATAEALGITRSAVYQWGDEVPIVSALHLERLTEGALSVTYLPMPGEVERRAAEG